MLKEVSQTLLVVILLDSTYIVDDVKVCKSLLFVVVNLKRDLVILGKALLLQSWLC